MRHICNPVNINYRYQFNPDPRTGILSIYREAADPSLILFEGKYYIFASMTLGVWVSEDLAHWENHPLPEELPLYDYAPDVRVINGSVWFCASRRSEKCDYYRTRGILNGPYEKVAGTFPFWDPNLFQDEDGRVYFYWGCASETPIYGVEVDPNTMKPLGEPKELIFGDAFTKGFERIGEGNRLSPRTEEEVDAMVQGFLASQGMDASMLSPDILPMIRGMFSQKPFVEGAWMTKHRDRYYLQYACPGTEFNTYADAVYVGSSPLGPFALAKNNPYSYHPGGFMPGAGHGSTMKDKAGNLWHSASMRISVNHNFERRVGIWPAGFDADGELFCNQRYGDWPMAVPEGRFDPWKSPDWFLLSVGKSMSASSFTPGHEAGCACDENAQTWWQAGSNAPGEWLMLDLGREFDVHAIQINFADEKIDLPVPGEIRGTDSARFIDTSVMFTRWKLEGSSDGVKYIVLKDKSMAETDLSHDLVLKENGIRLRYLRLTNMEVPYGQKPCVSGLRVFGIGDGNKPADAAFTAKRTGEMDLEVEMDAEGAVGYNILWGCAPDKLYHSYMTFEKKQHIGALVKGRNYYVRVDAFNENGITEGAKIVLV